MKNRSKLLPSNAPEQIAAITLNCRPQSAATGNAMKQWFDAKLIGRTQSINNDSQDMPAIWNWIWNRISP